MDGDVGAVVVRCFNKIVSGNRSKTADLGELPRRDRRISRRSVEAGADGGSAKVNFQE